MMVRVTRFELARNKSTAFGKGSVRAKALTNTACLPVSPHPHVIDIGSAYRCFKKWVCQRYNSQIKHITADKLAHSQYEKFKPIQDAEYKSDIDKKLKQALKFNPKDKK